LAGVVVYVLLVGQEPFIGATMDETHRQS